MKTKTKNRFRLAGLPLAVAALAGPVMVLSASGCTDDLCCSDFKPGSDMSSIDWGLEGQANVDFGIALQAIGDFSAAAGAIVTDLGVACRGISVDLGVDPKAVTATDPNEATKQWCSLAAAEIGKIKAEASLTIKIQPAKCNIDVSVQGSCEGSCQVDASCDPGSIEARCTGGEISGKCSGGCTGKCEGSANVAATCEGTCEGTCSGTCMGTCEGKCDGVEGSVSCAGQCEGSCSAECSGECRGSCTLAANAMVECNADCTGSCDVAMTAPKCTAEIEPPSCEASAECQASCKASASAKAECTPPAVTIKAAANSNIEAKIAVLEKWLPEIFVIAEARAELLLGNAEAMFTVAGNLEGAIEGDGKAVFCIIPAVAAIEGSVTNITATVEASVAVSGAVGG